MHHPTGVGVGRLGGLTHRVGGSTKLASGAGRQDRPGISLTSLAQGYNIVAAVGAHHSPSQVTGHLPPQPAVQETKPQEQQINNRWAKFQNYFIEK